MTDDRWQAECRAGEDKPSINHGLVDGDEAVARGWEQAQSVTSKTPVWPFSASESAWLTKA